MIDKKFSLIWSDDDPRQTFSSVNFVDDLKLNTAIDINYLLPIINKRLNLFDFFTLNKNTVKLRNEIFFDLIKNRNILPRLKELVRDLSDLSQINAVKMGSNSTESNLYAIKEINMYTDLIIGFYNLLHNIDFSSESLKLFTARIIDVYASDEFSQLCEETKKLDHKINNIRSVTIGLNLDSQLRPTEAGVVSVNEESFVSGNIIDKMLRLDLKDNPYACIAPLEAIGRGMGNVEKAAVNLTLNGVLGSIFSKSIANWKETIHKFNKEKTSWICSLFYEFCFILGCTDFLLTLSDRNYPLCTPEISDNEEIVDLYNPCLVINNPEQRAVLNNITFDGLSKIYILTGPNQGGKSIFTNAVGLLYSMLHLGLLLPAKSAKIRLVDNIFTHYPSKLTDRYQQGRFASECAVLSEISKKMTADSLFLFDESLSSTSNMESTAIAKELMTAYCYIGCKGIFATHLHDLCNMTDEINSDNNILSRIENLSAVLSDNSKERTFRIVKGSPYGKSFAFDIAVQYGLDKNTILASNKTQLENKSEK